MKARDRPAGRLRRDQPQRRRSYCARQEVRATNGITGTAASACAVLRDCCERLLGIEGRQHDRVAEQRARQRIGRAHAVKIGAATTMVACGLGMQSSSERRRAARGQSRRAPFGTPVMPT